MRLQRKWVTISIWVVLALLLASALRQVPLEATINILRQLQLHQILILMAVNLLILLLFSSRWWLILRNQGYRIPYISLVGYRLAGFAISYFTPGTQVGGEPLQVHLLQEKEKVPTPQAIASVALDKLFELLANFAFLLTGLILIVNGGLVKGLASPGAVLAISGLLTAPLGYLLLLANGKFPLSRAIVRMPAPLSAMPGIKKAWPLVIATERQISGLFRSHPLMVLWVLLLSGLVWMLMLVEYWLTLSFLGPTLDLTQVIVALVVLRLAFLAPMPAGLGALEAGQVFAFEALGFSPALGLSASLLIRARDISFGLLGLWLFAVLYRPARGKAPAFET